MKRSIDPLRPLDHRGVIKRDYKGVSRKRRKLRRDIEETMGEEWEHLESKVRGEIQEQMAKRHLLLRSSPKLIPVVEMILAGETAKNIRSFLRRKDPERFSPALISDNTLLQQIIRFKDEVMAGMSGENEEFSTTLDLYARFSGKHFDPMVMLKKIILVQEARTSEALEKESLALNALETLPPEKRARKFAAISRIASKEIESLQKMIMSYVIYELMNKPATHEQKAFVHSLLRAFRNHLPRIPAGGRRG